MILKILPKEKKETNKGWRWTKGGEEWGSSINDVNNKKEKKVI